MNTNNRDDDQRLDAASLPAVMTAVVRDAKALAGAHVDALRDDLGQRVDALAALVKASGAALALGIVTAMLAAAAIVLTLVALDVPAWIASWSVTVFTAACVAGLVARARRAGRATTAPSGQAARELAPTTDPS